MTDETPQASPKSSEPTDVLPAWIPRWMSERERAMVILAVGIVIASVALAIGIANMNPGGSPARHGASPSSSSATRVP